MPHLLLGSPPDHEGGVQGHSQGDLRDETRQPSPSQETYSGTAGFIKRFIQ